MKPLYQIFSDMIFQPLGMTHTSLGGEIPDIIGYDKYNDPVPYSMSANGADGAVSASTGKTALTLRKKTGLLEPWEEMAQKYRNGEVSRKEYDQWRYRYPRSEVERNKKLLNEMKEK